MKTLKLLMWLTTVTAVAITLSAQEEEPFTDENEWFGEPFKETEIPPTSLRGMGRFLAQKSSNTKVEKTRRHLTCDEYPKICQAKGSPGKHCCKNKCVNLKTDRHNCGHCGKKCEYNEMCCKGKCVNTLFHEKHCGSCFNKCKKGTNCVYGMCSYA